MNKIFLCGRLTREWDVKFTPNGGYPIATNTLAVNRYAGKGKESKTDFINIKMFGERANALTTHTTKGNQLLVNGNLEIMVYDDAKTKEKKQWVVVNIEQYDIIDWATKNPDENKFPPNDGWNEADGDVPF